MDLENIIVLVKPKAYEEMGKEATEEMIKADQRVLSVIKEGIIDTGEAQLKAMTGYSSTKIPDKSPYRPPKFLLDGITLGLKTTVQVVNPEYTIVFGKIEGFLEDVVDDWREGIRKPGIRTYEVKVEKEGETIPQKTPFIRWDYLMSKALKKISEKAALGAVNEVESIEPPEELREMELEKLVIPITPTHGFDITQPGSAKIWYLVGRFYGEVQRETVQPAKKEMEERTGVTKEEIPEKTREYWEQFENWLYSVKSIPSPRRQLGKVLNFLFTIPQKEKPKGSTELPVISSHDENRVGYYIKLLEEYRQILPTSLEQWKYKKGEKKGQYNYEEKIGELLVFYYGLEHDARILQQFPYVSEYHLRKEGNHMFISVQALYNRMKALERDYVANRLLRKHEIIPLI